MWVQRVFNSMVILSSLSSQYFAVSKSHLKKVSKNVDLTLTGLASVYFFPVHVPDFGTVADLGQQFRVSLGLV